MRTPLFIFLPLLFAFSPGMAQESATVYFDHMDQPCAADTAYYKKTGTKEADGKWHVFQSLMRSDQPFAEGYYPDNSFLHGDGEFIYYYDYRGKKVMEKGLYKNGKKEGLWKGMYPDNSRHYTSFFTNGSPTGISLSWYSTGELLDSTLLDEKGTGYEKGFWKDGKPSQYGHFLAWKKDGEWTYYYRNGRPSAIDNMKDDKRLSSTCFDENGHPSQQYCGLEVESEFPGGQSAWVSYLSKKMSNASFPKEYFDGKIYGQVIVEFIVDENGKVTEASVLQHLDPKLDQIALATINASPKWSPAIQYNRRVKSYKKQPVTFPKYPGSK